MIITTSEDLRNLTGSFYANNDFSKIENTIKGVETDICRILGMQSLEGLAGDAKLAAQQAVAFMATMRFYRLNDISHENAGRKVKIDKENEARPFEWQLARDDRAHLEEYYRALDRLVFCLMGNENFHQSALYQRIQKVIIGNADELTWLTGIEPSPWLYIQLLPFLLESQQFVEKAFEFQLIGCSLDGGREIIIPGVSVILRQSKSSNTGFLQYRELDDSFCQTVEKAKSFIQNMQEMKLNSRKKSM
jgi:hypothetical protein